MPRGKISRDNFRLSVAAQLPSPWGRFWKREKSPLLWGRCNLRGILADNLGEGNCESKIAAGQRGLNFCREGIKMSRRALWEYDYRQTFITDFQKALETTTAMKRRKISCKICSDCAVSNLSLHGRCISRSLHDSAKVVISWLLARNCCSLVAVVGAIFASQSWPGGEVVISRSLPLWHLRGLSWGARKS